MPARIDLAAARNCVWRPTIELAYSGAALALGGASIALQVRLYPGAAGAPLLDLQGVAFADAAAPTADDPDGRVLRLYPDVAELDLRDMPGLNQPEPGESQSFSYDAVVTYADGADEVLCYGYLILEPGVTV